jgi:hypothetical protein
MKWARKVVGPVASPNLSATEQLPLATADPILAKSWRAQGLPCCHAILAHIVA